MPARTRSWTALALALALLVPTAATATAQPSTEPPSTEPSSSPSAAVPPEPSVPSVPAVPSAPETPSAPDPEPEPAPVPDAPEPTGEPVEPDAIVPQPHADGVTSVPLTVVDPSGLAEAGVTEAVADAEAQAAGTAGDVLGLPPTVTGQARGLAAMRAVPDRVVVGLTAPLPTDGYDVAVMGAAWDPTDATVTVEYRLRQGDEWGAWETLATDDETEGGRGLPGTEPLVVTSGEEVQVRLATPDGAAPAGARLDVIGEPVGSDAQVTTAAYAPPTADDTADAGVETTGDVTTVPTSTVSASGTARPAISSRAAWGAVAPTKGLENGQVLGATVHHTAGTNTYTAAQVPGVIRGIQAYHMGTRGWSDIGYNFLIDRFGRIWEGRWGGVENTMKGVHASMYNGVTTGVSVMGNFELVGVSSTIQNALAALLGWKLALHGVEANGTMTVFGRTVPAIVGHRDVPDASTACPGRNLYALLPALRKAAANRQVFSRVMIDTDVSGDGIADAVVPSGAGRAYLGVGDPFEARRRIGNGWNTMDMVVSTPGLRDPRRVDLVYREQRTGLLSVYHGNGKGAFTGKTVWGYGWTQMRAVVGPGDWTGDGLTDLIAVDKSGVLWLYRGDGKGNLHRRVRIGHGWGNIRTVTAVGDVTGDGHVDLGAIVESTGELRVYPGDGKGGFLAPRAIGRGYGDYDAVVGIGDVTGDGRPDLMVRNARSGRMLTVGLDGRVRRVAATVWGSGWDTRGSLVSARGWYGDGRPVLITFDQSTGLLYAYRARTTTAFTAGATLRLPAGTVDSVVVGDVTGSGAASVVSRDSGGRLHLHEATGTGTFKAPRQIGQRWSGMRQITTAGDFTNDGVPDLLALAADGSLVVYPFAENGSGALEEAFQIGRGFGGFRVVGVGGWSRETSADVFAINRTTGELRWYVGRGRNGLTGGSVIGKGWRTMDVTALGDATGSGNNDLLARDTVTGQHRLYPGNGSGGFAPPRPVTGLPARTGDLP